MSMLSSPSNLGQKQYFGMWFKKNQITMNKCTRFQVDVTTLYFMAMVNIQNLINQNLKLKQKWRKELMQAFQNIAHCWTLNIEVCGLPLSAKSMKTRTTNDSMYRMYIISNNIMKNNLHLVFCVKISLKNHIAQYCPGKTLQTL